MPEREQPVVYKGVSIWTGATETEPKGCWRWSYTLSDGHWNEGRENLRSESLAHVEALYKARWAIDHAK